METVASSNWENIFLKILKRLLLITLGSGLLGNALYIYGLGYYQGYVEALGFEYNLFPIEWKDTLLWTYAASRELGLSSIHVISRFSYSALFIALASVYFIARIWMQIPNAQQNTHEVERNKKINFKLAKKLYAIKNKNIWVYRLCYLPFRWLVMKEQSFIAFAASYFFMIFLFFIPFFITVWIYFPWLGIKHGEAVAEERLYYYEEFLCGDIGHKWNQCLQIKLPESDNPKDSTSIMGRVLFKNGSLIALLTQDGPVTLTMPKKYYFETKKNELYEAPTSTDASK